MSNKKVTELIDRLDPGRPPNFRKNGQLYLVRCFKCDPINGRENWAMAVATGHCAWCGWPKEEKK